MDFGQGKITRIDDLSLDFENSQYNLMMNEEFHCMFGIWGFQK